MKDNSKYIAIILAILAVIAIIVSLITDGNKDSSNEPSIVTNASNFYTVNSCLYRFITYLSNEDKESLNLVISENYKRKNNITNNNVLSFFFDVDKDSTFVSEKMYYESISSNINKYYVKGHIEVNSIMQDEPLKPKNYNSVYFIVYLNSSDKVFSIEPYNGEIFKEGDSNEK